LVEHAASILKAEESFIYSEDGDIRYLHNVSTVLPNYMASHAGGRQQSPLAEMPHDKNQM
jgi:hypothetical protein